MLNHVASDHNGASLITDRNLQNMTDDELIDLLVELERVKEEAEKVLLAMMQRHRAPSLRR